MPAVDLELSRSGRLGCAQPLRLFLTSAVVSLIPNAMTVDSRGAGKEAGCITVRGAAQGWTATARSTGAGWSASTSRRGP